MKDIAAGIRRVRHILLLLLGITAIAALAQQTKVPSSPPDTIITAKEADAFLRAKGYPHGFESQLINALRLLSRDRNYRDSMPLYCATALTYYGWGLLYSDWLDIAKQLFDKAIIYCPSNDSATFYSIQSGLAYIDLRKGRRDIARKALEKVTDYHRRTNNLDYLARDIGSMGSYYFITDDKAKSLEMYHKALDICKKSGNHELECSLLIRIGNAFGDFKQRESILHKALKIEFDNHLPHLYSSTYLRLGRLYLDNGKPRQTLTAAKKAIDYANTYKQENDYVESLLLLADTYASLDQWQLANHNSREAADIIARQKSKTDVDISSASHKAHMLIRWCEDNVVVTPNGFVITEEKEHRLAIYAWLIAVAIVLAALIFLYSAMVRRKTAARLSDMATEEKVDELRNTVDALTAKTEKQEKRNADMAREIHYLKLFHSNFNPFMGRLRGMVMKAIGKDDATNTTVRNIGTFISLNTLPAYSTELDKEVCDEEKAFLERLQKQYPELKENEKQMCLFLRMGLSTQEICVLTGHQSRSVNMARYRLRKALNLAETDNLEAVVARI